MNQQPPSKTCEHSGTPTRASLTYTGQAGEHHRSDRSLLVKPWNFHRKAPTPVRPVLLNGQSGSSQETPNLPNRPTELQTDPNSKQQQDRTTANSPRCSTEQNTTGVYTGQTGERHRSDWCDLSSRDEQHPRVNYTKSNSRSPESLHGFVQDFGDSRNTSWVLHSQDLVHQNMLNQEKSRKSHEERL
jgi:hypothetical protein